MTVLPFSGYRPILDAMKTFAKTSDPLDIEVSVTAFTDWTVLNLTYISGSWFCKCIVMFCKWSFLVILMLIDM